MKKSKQIKPIPPEYLYWRKRVEGQIRHTMHEHPEYFTALAYSDNMVGRMAKRIIGEIVAGIITGNKADDGGTGTAVMTQSDDVQLVSAASGGASESCVAGPVLSPNNTGGDNDKGN